LSDFSLVMVCKTPGINPLFAEGLARGALIRGADHVRFGGVPARSLQKKKNLTGQRNRREGNQIIFYLFCVQSEDTSVNHSYHMLDTCLSLSVRNGSRV